MWHYTKNGDFPKECFGCLCEVINADSEKTYEVFCYNPKTEFWYDSWGDKEVAYPNNVIKWLRISDIDPEQASPQG